MSEPTPVPPPSPTDVRRAAWFRRVSLIVGVAVLALISAGDLGLFKSESTGARFPADEPGFRAFDHQYFCRELADGEEVPAPPADLDALVDCLRGRPRDAWPVGVFDVDGQGFLLDDIGGDVRLRTVPGCHRDRGLQTETTVVETLGWEFEAAGSAISFHPPGYGGMEVERFEQQDDDGMHAVGAVITPGPEPDPDVELPDTWGDHRHVDAVMQLYFCGVPLERAVALIEPQARG